MAKQKIPCPTALRLLLRYESGTGKLFWKRRGPAWSGGHKAQWASWNAQYPGREAFKDKHKGGYLAGYILGVNCLAHRVIMAMSTGVWPDRDVDHIDGNRQNNTLQNLRLASRSENIRNSGSRAGTSSRFCGVSWDKSRGLWMAGCYDLTGKRRHLGRFSDEADAARAYDAAAKTWHGEFARLNFPEDCS